MTPIEVIRLGGSDLGSGAEQSGDGDGYGYGDGDG